jgi:DNA-binding transcriptional LysR family regulator
MSTKVVDNVENRPAAIRHRFQSRTLINQRMLTAVGRVLDITPLRSLIAVADEGGFHRAAAALHLSQSAVSQHVRRLEQVAGQPLVTPDGRRTRFTPAGLTLLEQARQIIAAHDEALRLLDADRTEPGAAGEFVIGSTEHAADSLLPPIMAALTAAFPRLRVKVRLDRGARMVEAVESGSVDLAVYISEAGGRAGSGTGGGDGVAVGSLPLSWCAAPGWRPPTDGRPWPLVAIEAPCAIRSRAVDVLAAAGRRTTVVGEAAYLGGVLNAARAGLGVTLLALAGPAPEGLVELPGLPAAAPIGLSALVRPGTDPAVARTALDTLRRSLP